MLSRSIVAVLDKAAWRGLLLIVGGGALGFGAAALAGFHASFAQPLATVLAGAGALTAGVLAYVNGQRGRELTEAHHQADMRRAQESDLRARYTAIAAQISHGSAAIRQAGIYALTALADDWHAFGEDDERQVCINLMQWYLRVSIASDTDPAETLSEREIRQTIVGILAQRLQRPLQDRKSWAAITVDLHQAALPNCVLSGVNLSPLSFARANLTDVNLTGARLTDVDMNGADLTRACLTRADLTGANLTRANLTRATLSGATLTGAAVYGAVLTNAVLTSANLFQSGMTGAKLNDATLTDADLRGANLHGTDLTDANLYGATLTEAKLTGADLIGAVLIGADLTRVDLTDADLTRVDLTGANLTDADLTRANLTCADLRGADLTGADLTDADLSESLHSDLTRWPAGCSAPPPAMHSRP